MTQPTTTIDVHADRHYPVIVGRDVLGRVADYVGSAQRCVIVAQPTVVDVAQRVERAVQSVGVTVHLHVIKDAEAAKTISSAEQLWNVLGENACGRQDVIIGVGGGAATDLAGFVAATWLRGIAVIQVPTTVAGMVDAAVGGKTGVNTRHGKNLVGSFHSPHAVIADLNTLAGLPLGDVRAGLAEVLKCGFIADTTIVQLIADHPAAAIDITSDVCQDVMTRAIAVKARVVSEDLKEASLREILNYGHTFGHAIEHHQGYSWRHGDAVAVGMVYAAHLALQAGVTSDPALVHTHYDTLGRLGLPTSYPGGHWPELRAAMSHDKKVRSGQLRFVVLDAIGSPQRLNGPTEEQLQAAYHDVVSGPV